MILTRTGCDADQRAVQAVLCIALLGLDVERRVLVWEVPTFRGAIQAEGPRDSVGSKAGHRSYKSWISVRAAER